MLAEIYGPNGRLTYILLIFNLFQVTRGGMYVFQLADTYGASGLCLLWVAFFETVVIAWIYGKDKFYEDLNHMFGHKNDPRKKGWPIIGFMWKYAAPVICASVFFYFLSNWQRQSF